MARLDIVAGVIQHSAIRAIDGRYEMELGMVGLRRMDENMVQGLL